MSNSSLFWSHSLLLVLLAIRVSQSRAPDPVAEITRPEIPETLREITPLYVELKRQYADRSRARFGAPVLLSQLQGPAGRRR